MDMKRLANNTKQKETAETQNKCCGSCRFFDDSRGSDLALCRKWKIRTADACDCMEWNGEGRMYEAS